MRTEEARADTLVRSILDFPTLGVVIRALSQAKVPSYSYFVECFYHEEVLHRFL